MANLTVTIIDTKVVASETCIPRGCVFISVWNQGDNNASFNGSIIYPDQTINLPAVIDNNYPAMAYDKLTSELYIVYAK